VILGLTGVGQRIADAAFSWGVDLINVQFMTPLPGAQLSEMAVSQGRIALSSFPHDWKYFTFNTPVMDYAHLSRNEIIDEFTSCFARF
jgi:hypothetical protein